MDLREFHARNRLSPLPRERPIVRRLLWLFTILALTQAACSRAASQRPEVKTQGGLSVQVASYDVAKGREARFIVGLLTNDQQPLGGGTVEMKFASIGGDSAPLTKTGRFLPIPKESVDHHAGGQELPEGLGVYATKVSFDKAGNWEVTVEPQEGKHKGKSGKAAFVVLEKNRVPIPGDTALPTENHIIGSSDVSSMAIDSRASDGKPVPDPGLHEMTIKQALDAQRPALVVFSTPTFCVSRFCGPITDMVEDLSKKYPDKAAYIHIEIWRDRQANAINKAAADWLFRDDDLQEPWVFLIGADGRILERWDNVATVEEIEPLLKTL